MAPKHQSARANHDATLLDERSCGCQSQSDLTSNWLGVYISGRDSGRPDAEIACEAHVLTFARFGLDIDEP